ncbi:hypothetical protein [uncultured Acinetobacter sp.]|uniref:hypothetical protein n=1 Tax=uncultured Acinetobacter sp. TaxID=165433 RepID=UPI002588007C|nr:hypothetical protein [uncultured Acinetobacter sp.]
MRIASILLLVIVLLTLLFFYFQPSETAIPIKQSTAQAQAGQLDQPSHLNNITTQDVTSHSVTHAEQQASDSAPLADTKSDLSIQPIDPEKDPGNQIIKP